MGEVSWRKRAIGREDSCGKALCGNRSLDFCTGTLRCQTESLVTTTMYTFRYRNFRTFASPRPVQFSCLTLDPSGEVVCAGSHDTFEVYVWSMQTGRLLEVRLASHDSHMIVT